MTQHALLNNLQHRDVRIITANGAEYGDNVMAAITFPSEFRSIQTHYPIVFAKDREDQYAPVALFGFREKQNLFLDGNKWDATYLPLMIDRQPFLIGNSPNGKVIHLDLDSPRVSRTDGHAVFLEHGGNSPFLERVGNLLATIDEGLAGNPPFIAALLEHKLLESFALDIEFRDGTKNRFTGFYAIQEEKLKALDGAALAALHQQGFLAAIYMTIASFSRFRDLIERASKLNAADR
ncbi:MAG TPA: SapC family protein [Steroidobacteraceae bacterium]|nr:SapC family protein [Steroidobacteraceae bacterium]